MTSLDKRLADLREQLRKHGKRARPRNMEEVQWATRHIKAHIAGRCQCNLAYDHEENVRAAQQLAFGGKRQGLRVVK
jgi:hypothetical protein